MKSFKEHIEQLEEMPGANMDTRKVVDMMYTLIHNHPNILLFQDTNN